MIGGIITEVIIRGHEPERIFLNVQDKTYKQDRCGIYVERNEDSIRIFVGDQIWWQGKTAYWTSKKFPHAEDVAIPRASYSGVDHPDGKDVLDHALIRNCK